MHGRQLAASMLAVFFKYSDLDQKNYDHLNHRTLSFDLIHHFIFGFGDFNSIFRKRSHFNDFLFSYMVNVLESFD
ncbi:hypothetical protein BAE31_14250 [Bacillus sp. I-2]|nr:hypothetical protein BAE31_14250 [Bacillus sp. I-2]